MPLSFVFFVASFRPWWMRAEGVKEPTGSRSFRFYCFDLLSRNGFFFHGHILRVGHRMKELKYTSEFNSMNVCVCVCRNTKVASIYNIVTNPYQYLRVLHCLYNRIGLVRFGVYLCVRVCSRLIVFFFTFIPLLLLMLFFPFLESRANIFT